MTEKDLIAIFNNDFQNGGDCYGEELTSINWNSLQPSDECDREEGCKVVAGLSPSGSGFVWLCIKDGKLYTNWETKMATTLIEDDGSDYYKELYNKVKEHYPDILIQKKILIPGIKMKSPEVVIAIIERDSTFFGLKNILPSGLCTILQNEIPELHFSVEHTSNYPFGPCIKVNTAKCKLDLKYNSWLEKTKVSFIVYK